MRAGAATFHGPNVPRVSIRPRGCGFSSTVSNDIGNVVVMSRTVRRCMTKRRGSLRMSRGRIVSVAASAVIRPMITAGGLSVVPGGGAAWRDVSG